MAATRTYLVPVDFSESAERALAYAMGIAKENRANLLLVHVVDESSSGVPLQLREAYLKSLQKEAKIQMNKLVNKFKLPQKKFRTRFLSALDAPRAIADQAKRSRVSMIIMGSHGRTGIPRFILGSVAEQTLRHASCPVLIVKGSG